MATILLSAAGAAIGGGFGGSILGLSGAVIGRAIGATIGQAIDQKLLGPGSRAVETGKIDRFRLTGASEGAPVGLVWGRMRLAGQVIWASRFQETVTTSGGGKGAPSQPKVTEYSYSVNVALALCEGTITRVGRVWADGVEIAKDELNLRVYRGSETQGPDPKIEAVEGAGFAPAYRGTAYVVIEDLDLSRFGNRVPQFTFEVMRPAQGVAIDTVPDLTRGVRGVALIPGTGEYALATTPVHVEKGLGENVSANVHAPGGGTDFSQAVEALTEELPNVGSVSLVVSWFGDDLRCGSCSVKPKVENRAPDGQGMVWRAGGIGRTQAEEVVRLDGRPAYGGTPADASVIEAIRDLTARGKSVVFYPFVLMEQMAGNGLTDPWGAAEQPAFPWRGRITASVAPGRAGSPDGTATAAAQVAAFFGTAQPGHFAVNGTAVSYAGPVEWSYRRFILHYAHLCAAAGGVGAFCIGSEMRGLTQLRGAGNSFPAVAALRQLAAEVRAILGPGVKIGYAADWTEYAGYQAPGGDLYFHLDPLWADANVDFVGIDNYLPLSDWREGITHADAGAGSVYSLGYLKANVEGGEGYDWFYASKEDRDGQVRTPITDGAHGEPWVYRVKDIRSWWANVHHDRVAGVRAALQTAWEPKSKPIWFTEFGCPAVDKGTNEPNKFIDPKSSESVLPHYSNGRRDDLMQMQYLRAVMDHWGDPAVNPVSPVYGGRMVDMGRAHVWAWDARPFPQFPGNRALWSDGGNYALGHWLSGRATAQPLSSVVAEICARSGVTEFDVSELYGLVRGYQVADVTSARAALQPLMIAYGFEAVERDGAVRFRMRDGIAKGAVEAEALVAGDADTATLETVRASAAEVAGRVRLTFVESEGDYEARAVEAVFPDEETVTVAQTEIPIVLTQAEGRRTVERWLAEARVSRDTARFVLPPSMAGLGAGDVVELAAGEVPGRYRIDRVEQAGALSVEAVRVEPGVFEGSDASETPVKPRPFLPPVPVLPVFLDLPLMSGSEVPHAPHLAVTANPWPGSVAVYASDQDAGYTLDRTVVKRAVVGVTETALGPSAPGLWDRGAALRVRLTGGAVASASVEQVLNGANLMAIGDGSAERWELFQFAEAQPVSPGVYDLSMRLRGQAGTEAVAPGGWPAGSKVVLMDGAPQQIGLGLAERDLARHYRIGPAQRPPSDGSYVHLVEAFAGVGLRPYAPAQLRVVRQGGNHVASWVRRTRVGGDSWSGLDVPLGEARELYLVRVYAGAVLKREETVGAAAWTYGAALRASDGVAQSYEIHVAQVSETFGTGPFARISVNV